ncbi:Maltose acetyltransferase [Phytophthora boehmeriae]|uniref:Maltose acetyltransferase n=1 Tax=Phytophthora boehmeriae TaxID=109152 RepID=A0A8T1WVK2_9STRA|nr:Maltose acetyltransferase [Phytophthora boehmeriae]
MSWSAGEGQSAGVDDVTPSVSLASTSVTNDSEDSEDDSGPDQDADYRAKEIEYRRTHGSCTYYPSDERHPCQIQRSCFDCLNFNITSEPNGCFVNPMGQCVPVTKYDPALDFQLGSPSNDLAAEYVTAGYNGTSDNSTEPNVDKQQQNQQYNFLAGEAKYCKTDDPQCLLCRATVFASIIYHHSDDSRSRYCVGQDGCVCIAICEALEINHNRPDKRCMINAMATKGNQDSGPNTAWASVAAIVGAMCFIVASVFVIYRIRSRGENSASDGGSSHSSSDRRGSNDSDGEVITPDPGASPIATATPVMRAGSGSGLLLNLFGWTAMRDVLVQKEHLQASGVEDAAFEPVKNNVQLIGAQPSAPDVEGALPTAPSVIPYATLAVASAPIAVTVRAMAAPSAPDFEEMDVHSMDGDDVDMAVL